MKTFTKNDLLSLIDALDEWIYRNNLSERKDLETPIRRGRFNYPNLLYNNFTQLYKTEPFKAICKWIMIHYEKIIYKTDKLTYVINDYKTLYKELKKK